MAEDEIQVRHSLGIVSFAHYSSSGTNHNVTLSLEKGRNQEERALELSSEQKTDLETFKDEKDFGSTIWSKEMVKCLFLVALLSTERKMSQSGTSEYWSLSGRIDLVRTVMIGLKNYELDTAFKATIERNPEKTTELQLLSDRIQSGEPLPEEYRWNGRTKMRMGNVAKWDEARNDSANSTAQVKYNRWNKLLASSILNDNFNLISATLRGKVNTDDRKLVRTLEMSAQEASEKLSDRDSAMEINGQAVHTRVVDAIAVASNSLFLARTNEPDPIAEKVKRIYNDGIKDKRNLQAIADDTRKLVRGAM